MDVANADASLAGPNLHPRVAPERILLERTTIHGEDAMGELIDKVKGKIKKAVGKATGDKKLEREGKVDEAKGKVKGVAEEAKQAVKDAVK